jgi:hypothetical protein
VKKQLQLEIELGSFEPGVRSEALSELHRLLISDQVSTVPELPIVNLHSHTFFSFNAYHYSPSGFSWEAKKRGLYAAGIIDFDVLHGVDEFLQAGRLLGLRATAGIESRVFVDEWSNIETNSPREPGVYYAMGYGFTGLPPRDRSSRAVLDRMGTLSRRRNELMLEKLNRYLSDVQVSYEEDVLPLTPSGNATERHMLVALDQRSRQVFPDRVRRGRFWADALNVDVKEAETLISQPVNLQMLIRARLMKHGGPAYCAPDRSAFPTLEEMFAMVLGYGAVPTAGWLDGTSEGEKDADAFLDFLVGKGAACLTVIPDRNWNLKDAGERRLKVARLNQILQGARARKLPVIVGTEMNKNGQKFVDDFFTDALRPFGEDFLEGARILHGHTLAQRALGIGILSGETRERFGNRLEERNRFFEAIGKLVPGEERPETSGTDEAVRRLWRKNAGNG